MKKLINLYQEDNFPTSHENAREVSRLKIGSISGSHHKDDERRKD